MTKSKFRLICLLFVLVLTLAAAGTAAAKAEQATLLDDPTLEVKFEGEIISGGTGTFQVQVQTDGDPVIVDVVGDPNLDYSALVGQMVKVEGTLGDGGVINATEVEVHDTGDDDPNGDDQNGDDPKPDDPDGDDMDGDDVSSDDPDDQDEDMEVKQNYYCVTEGSLHPVGNKIAEGYDEVSYEQVMEYFCEHKMGFGQIMLALQSAEAYRKAHPPEESPEPVDEDSDTGDDPTGEPEDELGPDSFEYYLMQREAGKGWGVIWKQEGLTRNQFDHRPKKNKDAEDTSDDQGDTNGDDTSGDDPNDVETPDNTKPKGNEKDKPDNAGKKDDKGKPDKPGQGQDKDKKDPPGQQKEPPGQTKDKNNKPPKNNGKP